ncbi:TlpA family protein disulfide reductase [Bremerella sp. P1]|uniref:TlpA family protein disulfide reductase n=1 Tax=Bremerella sp. P1 TaxID=3026424 RepID=UPI0023686B49|nr:TlpA disulfide reductase family protein [Bremerella sp. P1]WDI40916.1 TlpA disulfide reductase family protein [Bremerella sp. P1]
MRVRVLLNKSCWSAVIAASAGLTFAGCGGGEANPPAVSIEQSGSPSASAPASNAAPVQQPTVEVTASNTAEAPANPATAAPTQRTTPAQLTSTQQPNGGNAPAANMPAQGAADMQINAGGNPAAGQPELPPPLTAAELAAQMDLNNVPDGTPTELLTYMNNLTAVPFPDNATPQELRQFATKVYSNVITAADKLLVGQAANSEERRNAVQFKFNAYEMLIQILPNQAEQIRQERIQFAQNIAQSKDPEVSRFARLFLFEQMLAQFAAGEPSLFQPVLEDSRYIIEDPNADIMHFGVAENAATVFARMGHTNEAVSILTMMKNSFTGTKDEKLAARAAELDDMIMQYKILGTMMAAANGDQAAEDQLVAAIRAWIATKPKEDLEPLQMLSTIEMQMEDYRKMQLARKLANLMLEFYGNHPDPQVVESVNVSVSNAEKRTGLIAKPFVVEGNNLNGTPFDWSQYKGKWVLVDFWATWCPICIEEMGNIKQVYQKYRAKGFEVVSINLDEDPRARSAFFQSNALPWPTVVSADPNSVGFMDPNAQRCGVEALPFLVFVGPDGTVVEINPRGERLEELLQSVLNKGAGGVGSLSNPTVGVMQQVPGATAPANRGQVQPPQQVPATAEADVSLKVVR